MNITNNTIEKLNELFSNAEFLERNKNADSFDAVFESVHICAPEITKDDLSEYLEIISKNMDSGEISEDDLEDVAGGGLGILAIAAGITAVCTAVRGCYAVGTGIGKFIYNITHR